MIKKQEGPIPPAVTPFLDHAFNLYSVFYYVGSFPFSLRVRKQMKWYRDEGPCLDDTNTPRFLEL